MKAALALLLWLAGCHDGNASRLKDVMATNPDLAATGYGDPAMKAYQPRFPLYSDGQDKARYILLPADQTIDASVTELWKFPVGTKLWKEFAKDGVKIETRFMEKSADHWSFGTYLWNAEQTAATLWSGDETASTVPSFDQCLTCHRQTDQTSTSVPDPVLGYSGFQLDRAVIEDEMLKGTITGVAIDWDAHAIPAKDQKERDVIGYLHGNCGHCHNARRNEFVPEIGGDTFQLDYNLASVHGRDDINLLKLIDRPVANQAVAIPQVQGPVVIRPGKTKESMLYYRMTNAPEMFRMPKTGIVMKDQVFITKLKSWIKGLAD